MDIAITVIETSESLERRERNEGSGVAGIKIVKRKGERRQNERGSGRERGNFNSTKIEEETSEETMTDRVILLE
jgi:hypothetical protein